MSTPISLHLITRAAFGEHSASMLTCMPGHYQLRTSRIGPKPPGSISPCSALTEILGLIVALKASSPWPGILTSTQHAHLSLPLVRILPLFANFTCSSLGLTSLSCWNAMPSAQWQQHTRDSVLGKGLQAPRASAVPSSSPLAQQTSPAHLTQCFQDLGN